MSTLLISLNNYNLSTINCAKSFKNIDWKDVDCFIFHSSSDSDLEIIKELSNIKGKVDKVIYINKNINPLYFCIFTGLDADIYNSEENLMDETILTFLVDNYKNTGMTMKSASSDLETLAKSIATISTSNIENLQKLVSNDFWMKTLNTAVSNIDNTIARAEQINVNVVDMFHESSKLIKELEDSSTRTSDEIEELRHIISDFERKTRPSTPFIFTSYQVPVTAPKVLYVKAYGHCRFLNSFILSYRHYLRMQKQINCKVLFLLPKLKITMKKFSNVATRLAPDSIDIVDFNSSNIFATFEPKKLVMDSFFSQSNVQLFIIVDLMFGDKLINGPKVKEFYAVSGLSDMEMFNLPTEKCIITMFGRKGSIMIPLIKKCIGASEADKRSLYFDNCQSQFEQLNNALELDRG